MTQEELNGVKTLLPFLAIKHIDPQPFADVIKALEAAWAERDALTDKLAEAKTARAELERRLSEMQEFGL